MIRVTTALEEGVLDEMADAMRVIAGAAVKYDLAELVKRCQAEGRTNPGRKVQLFRNAASQAGLFIGDGS